VEGSIANCISTIKNTTFIIVKFINMKKLKGLIIQNRIKYLKGISIMFVIGVLANLLFKHHPFSLNGFFPILVIFCYGVYKDYKSIV
jgi:hypothetical protein